MTDAMSKKEPFRKKRKFRLSDLKPVSYGPGSERGSLEVDKTVYSP